MNSYAKQQYPECPIRGSLHMTVHHFWKFFYLHGGKLKRPITKPRLTREHVIKRLAFGKKWSNKYKTGGEDDVFVAFLDEKWFYTSSRRKKMKILPRALFESEEEAFIAKPKLRSRRFPCKVMFLGVICPPVKGHTDGRILLMRVSKSCKLKRQSYHQHFVGTYEINHRLKGGEWKSLFPKEFEITTDEFLSVIQDTYDIDDDIAQDLVFTYSSLSITKKTGEPKSKLIKLTPNDSGPVIKHRKIKYLNNEGVVCERSLLLDDLQLKVNPQKGTWVERDINCDSTFMMEHIRMIGRAIRDSYSFLPHDKPIHLFMDNAGGHGKTEIKKQYETLLKDEFHILIEWQVPNSPETNMLDLGVWVALQSLVEKLHRGKVMQADELTKTVMESFKQISRDVLTRVYDRWKLTLQLIVSGKGTNEVVEDYRGFNKPIITENLPTVPDSECTKGYEYHDAIDVIDDEEGEVLDEDEEADDGVYMEMAFDDT